MYYHELITQIAKGLVNASRQDLCKVESQARDLLLSREEANAIQELIDAALCAVEDMKEVESLAETLGDVMAERDALKAKL
jgi:hypothetical protein